MNCAALAGLTLALCGQVNLTSDAPRWSANVDSAGATMTMLQTPDAKVAVDIVSDGAKEHYPKLRIQFSQPQDWSRYMRMRLKMRVTADNAEIRSKQAVVVFYDEKTRREDLADRPMTQQGIWHSAPPGKWVEYTDWLLGIKRTAIRQVDIYLYDAAPAKPHSYRWEFAKIDLEGAGEKATVFDTEVYDGNKLRGRKTSPAAKAATDDGLELTLGTGGDVNTVSLDGRVVGASGTQPSGLLVRDVAAGGLPTMVGGKVEQKGKQVQQSARMADLGLGVDATYRSRGGYLEIAGTVTDLTGKDRAVTVYFAVPASLEPWTWWDSIAASRTGADPVGEFASLETGRAWGLNGAHSRYPLGAITRDVQASSGTQPRSTPGAAGLSLAIRMDEPVSHRIAYNPSLNLFYVALDFGLVPEKRIDGSSLATVPFRVLLYRHDPAWGFRSALQRYYGFFPEFFTRRVAPAKEGGWFVWGKMQDMPGALDGGFGFHWGPSGSEAVKWDNAHGPLALLYIEPEYLQLTMGDFKDHPTPEQCIDRLRKLAAGDEAEMAKTEKLSYARGYAPGLWVKEHSLRQSLQSIAQAAVNSGYYDVDGNLYSRIGQYSWMGESKWGNIFPCNLDPKIPNGKGRFNSDVYLATGLREMEAAGGKYDGIGLDSLGGYGQERANYRREHFKYGSIPLTFSNLEHVPVQAANFTTLEWMRELAQDMHSQGKVLMANCSWGSTSTPAWLTFAGVYLDIFGAEATQFGDPDFIRAIAYRKPCTDLPYDPRPDWEVAWHLLHGIYPGHGNKVEVMQRYAKLLREMSAAGWEPITLAHASVATPQAAQEKDALSKAIRIERFGSGQTVYLSLHNPNKAAAKTKVKIDAAALGIKAYTATQVLTGESVTVANDSFELMLDPQGTVVVVLKAG